MAAKKKQEEEISLAQLKQQVKNSREEERKQGDRIQLIVFKLGEGEYAIPINDIKEVVITPPIAKVPQTPNYVKGVANIRGNVIAIMDLMEKFNLAGDTLGKANYTLVLESEDYKVGILVREVPNTLTIYSTDIDTTSNIMQYSSLDDEFIEGIVSSDNRLIILLNILAMMEGNRVNEITNI